jgi:hypothetical protein
VQWQCHVSDTRVDAWLDVRVTKHAASGDDRLFRRRIPLELTATETGLLEGAQPRYGSKRATLVAGLEALAAVDQHEQRLAEAEAARDAALAEAAALVERVETAELGAASQAEKTKTSSQSAKAATGKLEQQLQRATQQVTELRQALVGERDARLAWEQAYAELQAEELAMLRCARCKQLAPPHEWAAQPAKDGGQLVYHKPCGFHQEGVVNPSTIMAYRHG